MTTTDTDLCDEIMNQISQAQESGLDNAGVQSALEMVRDIVADEMNDADQEEDPES